jgi:hypothetical protein
MQLRLLLILFVACIEASCASPPGPRLTVHVSDPSRGGMDYFDSRKEQRGFIPYSQTDKLVCFSPTDLEALLTYCKSK